jgi:hypothetical protein
MPAYEPISIPDFVKEKYQHEIKTIKKYLAEAFPEHSITFGYSVELFSIGFTLAHYTGQNVIFFKSMFLENLDSPLDNWLKSSGIKEFVAMNTETTLVIDNDGKLLLR